MTNNIICCFLCYFFGMMTNMRTLGERIDLVLTENGISRAGLGELLGVGQGAVGRYIRNESDPGSAGLAKIAEIGKVSIDWLVTGNGDQYKPAATNPAIETAVRESAGHWNKLDTPPTEFEVRIIGMLRRLPQDNRQRFLDLITSAYFDEMEKD